MYITARSLGLCYLLQKGKGKTHMGRYAAASMYTGGGGGLEKERRLHRRL